MTIRPKNNHTNKARKIKINGMNTRATPSGLEVKGYRVQRAKPKRGPENIVVNFANLKKINDTEHATTLAAQKLEIGEELIYSHNLGATYYFLIETTV